MYNASLYAALLLGYTIHFIYCIWGNLRITLSPQAASGFRCRYLLPSVASSVSMRPLLPVGSAQWQPSLPGPHSFNSSTMYNVLLQYQL